MGNKPDISVPQTGEWAEFHKQKVKTRYHRWPNEAMLKVLFGSYLNRPVKIRPSFKVLDCGCGFGNNLLPFLDLGCECHGVEIEPEIAKLTSKILEDRGYSARILRGSNRSIPYEDHFFDLLISINTLHYEGSEENVLAALQEFRRVLKPGGRLYLSTVGPGHEIFKRSEPLGDHRYRIKNFDFRDGQVFFFFRNKRHLSFFLGSVFEDVETGQVTEKLMTLPLDFLIGVCQ